MKSLLVKILNTNKSNSPHNIKSLILKKQTEILEYHEGAVTMLGVEGES